MLTPGRETVNRTDSTAVPTTSPETGTAEPASLRSKSHADTAAGARTAARARQRYRPALRALEEGDAARVVAARERNFRYALALADMAAMSVSALLAVAVIGDYQLRLTYLAALPLIVVVAKVLGLYERDQLVIRKSTTDELPRLINLATTVTLILWLGRRYVVIGQPPTAVLLALWVLLGVTTASFRIVARSVAARISAVERCLFVGDANTFHHVGAKLSHTKHAELVDYRPDRRGAAPRGPQPPRDRARPQRAPHHHRREPRRPE